MRPCLQNCPLLLPCHMWPTLVRVLSAAGPTFIELEGARSNLVLIRTLRDSGSLDIRGKLKKCLTLDCVRNKDRMAIEPIVCLTKPTVLDVLEEVTFVVHTVVPESVASGNQIKVYRPLHGKDLSPLHVEPKAKFLRWATILILVRFV